MLKISRSGQQFAAVALGLTVIGVLLYGPNAIHGGFLSDAWADRAAYAFVPKPSFFHGVARFMEEPNVAVRPLLAVYLSWVNAVFGGHMGFWIAWLVATNVAMCLLLYLLLRRLSMGAIDAAAVAVLVFIFPAAGALRLWSAMLASPVTISLALTGFLLALVAFEMKDRRWSYVVHGVSLAFFACSVLLYELCLPAMLLSVLVYRIKVGWRPAIYRWLVDCVVLLTIALSVTRSSDSGFMQSYGGMFDHAREIYGQLPIMLTKVVLPFGSSRWYISLLLALVPLTAAVIYRRLPDGDELRADLRRWGFVMAAGTILVLISYTIFIPALSYYVPLRAGIADRINAVPEIGWVLLFYGGARMIGAIVFRGVPDGRRFAQGLAVVGCALVALGWVKVVKAESDSYTGAFKEDLRVLASIQASIPEPVENGTIWTFGQPVLYAPEIPVFGNTWDMTTAVQLQYDDPSLASYVALPETVFECGAKEMQPGGAYQEPEAALLASPYGRTYFVNTVTGEAVKIDDQAECLRAASSFVPSPLFRE